MTMLCSVSWTREEEKAFENAIAMCYLEQQSDEQWDKVASMVPSKTIEELKQHYQILVEDVSAIEAGQIPLPYYGGNTEEEAAAAAAVSSSSSMKQCSKDQRVSSSRGNGCSGFGSGTSGRSKLEQERKKGIPWTEEEHRLFLLGLEKFGKGDWRSISRNFVLTRTPTQVASHAQKYFIRLNSMNRDRRRSSIHDITSIDNGTPSGSPHQAPITGTQQHGTSPTTGTKHRPQPNMPPSVGLYGTQMGHPILAPPGHMTVSAVGTPLMLPPPRHHHPPHYAVPVAYPMPPPPPMHHRR